MVIVSEIDCVLPQLKDAPAWATLAKLDEEHIKAHKAEFAKNTAHVLSLKDRLAAAERCLKKRSPVDPPSPGLTPATVPE